MRGPSKTIIVLTQSVTFSLVIPTISDQQSVPGNLTGLGIVMIDHLDQTERQRVGLVDAGDVAGLHGDIHGAIGRLRASVLPETALSGMSPRR
jgi:hypothetical protein